MMDVVISVAEEGKTSGETGGEIQMLISRGFHGNSIATKWLYRLTDVVDWEEIARYYIDEIDS